MVYAGFMIRQVVKSRRVTDGRPSVVIRLLPETAADLREIDRLRRAGLLEHRNGFADDPAAWRLRRR